MIDLESIAKDWLDRQWESSGPKAEWSQAAWDKYHAELGLLISFSQDIKDDLLVPELRRERIGQYSNE